MKKTNYHKMLYIFKKLKKLINLFNKHYINNSCVFINNK